MKLRRGNRGITPYILNLGAKWRYVDGQPTLHPFYLQERVSVPDVQEARWNSGSARTTLKTKSLGPTGVLSPDRLACVKRDAIVTTLFRPTYGVQVTQTVRRQTGKFLFRYGYRETF